ncbi:unnamed protein product [Oikopleura dioica]|uniref:ZP domain-containing protein n=1 Tax=Oikopleura dioica TaxID=34765 RepID=E4Y4F0_OIKDI|nr:unnamed protein product [Oikopleura dioica]
MKLFNDASFEEELEDLAEKGYAQVAVREFIYVRVAFDFAEDGAAMATDKVVIDSCWGSRSANPDNMNTAYMMIKNGCSADPLGVIIRKNSAGEYASWKFQMYKWVEVAQHEQFIYIHCRAWICTDCKKPEANHACLGDITKFRRRRSAKLFQNREVSSDRARIFSVGPIYPRDGSVPLLSDVKSDDPAAKGDIQGMPIGEEEEEDNFIMAVIVGSVSGFCALFLLIVAIVFVKKYRDKPFQIFTKPAEEEEDEKNVEQGFVFELRTSTDPVIPRVNLDQFLGRDDEPREQRERKTERRSHHGSRMSLNKDDRGGRRRRDRSESRDRKGRSRSESRTREGGRSGSKDRGKDRDRSRSRERSSRHGSREKLHSSSRDLRKSRDNIRGSKSDLRERRSGSRDDLTSGSSKMRKSGSRMSLNDRLPTLDERLSSEAEKVIQFFRICCFLLNKKATLFRTGQKNC